LAKVGFASCPILGSVVLKRLDPNFRNAKFSFLAIILIPPHAEGGGKKVFALAFFKKQEGVGETHGLKVLYS